MRYFNLAVMMILCITYNVYGQLPGEVVGGIPGGLVRTDPPGIGISPGIGTPFVPLPRIVAGPTNSAADRDGNIFLFDVIYTAVLPMNRLIRVPTSMKTRITIISNQGIVKSETVDGTYQVLGAGQYGIYAMITKYGGGMAAGVISVTRELVVFTGTTGQVTTTLHLGGDVRLSPAVDNRPDVISIVDYAVIPIFTPDPMAGPLPMRQRRAQLIRFNGVGGFQVSEPVVIP